MRYVQFLPFLKLPFSFRNTVSTAADSRLLNSYL